MSKWILWRASNNLRGEKGYAVTDERHRLTLYGEAQLPWRFSFAPIYTFGSGVPADTFLPGTRQQRRSQWIAAAALAT
jgi:hypothetical protein